MARLLKVIPYLITSITYLFLHLTTCCNVVASENVATTLVSIQKIYYTSLFVYIAVLYSKQLYHREYIVSTISNFTMFLFGITYPEMKYLPLTIGNAVNAYLALKIY